VIFTVLISVFCSLLTAVGVNYGIKKLHFRKLRQEMRTREAYRLDKIEQAALNRDSPSWFRHKRQYKILKSCFTPTVPPLPPPIIIISPQERNRKTHQL
jgi:hypothetical protein